MKIYLADSNNKFCGHWNDSPMEVGFANYNKVLPSECLHSHDFYEYYAIISGKALMQVNGSSVDMLPNTVLMIEPGEKHQVTWVDPELGLNMLVIKQHSTTPNKTIHN